MAKVFSAISVLLILLPVSLRAQYQPAEDLGDLFAEVQLEEIFTDSKTFPDCVPRYSPERILKEYHMEKNKPDFDLGDFVRSRFELPYQAAEPVMQSQEDIEKHISQLWSYLTRKPRENRGSLITLPHPYIVPGGRFREIYYWDSYFTMLGLAVDNRHEIIRNMVDNFAWLIEAYGFIPNGNRTYYLSRSQPPFFSFMVELLAGIEGDSIYIKYLPHLKLEYDFWMKGSKKLSSANRTHKHLVLINDTLILNRYWDNIPKPRPEAYREDVMVYRASNRDSSEVYRDIRAACESGWDFSSRWLKDDKRLTTIETTRILPVDLNSLLYHLETTLANACHLAKNSKTASYYHSQAAKRKTAINSLFWDEKSGLYQDLYWETMTFTGDLSLAGMYPFFMRFAPEDKAESLSHSMKLFSKPGGLVSTLTETGQQWDYPNAWAPLQWIGSKGLEYYGKEKLSEKVASRWSNLVNTVYEDTGKLMEKYNVVDTTLKAGGGEYPTQDGFGWTNGVYLKMNKDQ